MMLLAGLGFVGYKLGMVLYRKIQELDIACQFVHNYSPASPGILFILVSGTGALIFLGIIFPFMLLANIPVAIGWITVFTFCIAMVFSTMKTLIEKSSSDVAWALFYDCFLLALLFVLTFVGVVGFIALMVFKKDALQTERRQEFDRLRIDVANSAMNGPL
jgi:hypothetical protein